jgi:Arc/MetJ-type ribon-helix-helix transcriptional regulator
MTIKLKPELETLIKQDIQHGPYQTVEEFVESAVSMLHEQETWLTQHRADIALKIEEGYKAAQRGELMDGGQVRARMEERKQAWMAEHHRDE